MKFLSISLLSLSSAVLIACGVATKQDKTSAPPAISFLAFGDGGYSVKYPKAKHIKKPKTPSEFLQAELDDWLEEHRPINEFNHAPLYVYPGSQTTTEMSGAVPVGLAMASACETMDCQFAIQLGDNIYPDGADAGDGKDDQKRMDDLILAPLQPLFDQQPELVVYSALGNHDWKSSRKGVALQTAWMAAQPNFHMGQQGYYSYKKGEPGNDVEFFVIDSNMLLAGQTVYDIPLRADGSERSIEVAEAEGFLELDTPEPHEGPQNGEDIAQLHWLEQGLKNSTAKWKIVYGHHILWSIGGSKYGEGHVLRRLLLPSLCQYADAYIAGHEHDLELLTDDCSKFGAPADKPPLPLIVSGSASKMRGIHSLFAAWQERTYTEYELIWNKAFIWGFAHVELDNVNDQLQVTFYTTHRDQSGRLTLEYQHHFPKRSL